MDNRELYNECITKLYKPEYKVCLKKFINIITNNGKQSIYNNELIIKTYTNTDTYFSFFNELKKIINNNEELCLTLQMWIENLILNQLFNNKNILIQSWIVVAANIPKVDFKDPWLVDEHYLGSKKKFDKLLQTLSKQFGGSRTNGYKIL